MKTLDEILAEGRPAINNGWKDRPILSSYAPFRGMTAADFDGMGNEDEFIPGLDNN